MRPCMLLGQRTVCVCVCVCVCLCVQMLQQPGMRQMMSSMLSNPAYIDQILSSNPMLRQVSHFKPSHAAEYMQIRGN